MHRGNRAVKGLRAKIFFLLVVFKYLFFLPIQPFSFNTISTHFLSLRSRQESRHHHV
jgi:hypothetical protein